MADQAKNILIGIFVIAACAIIVFVLLFLHPSVGDEGQTLRVRFADIDKVTLGTRVTYGGKPVGEVIAIDPIQLPPSEVRKPINGVVYIYELLLRVDSHVKVYNTDLISLRTSGLLGERSVEITPEPIKENEPLELVNKKILYASETGTVEDTLKEIKKLVAKVDDVMSSVHVTVTDFNEKKILDKVNKTMQHMASITRALDNPKQLSETFTNFNTLSRSVNESWKKLDLTLAKVDQTVNNFNQVSLDLSRGEGSIGRLIARDDLYLQLTSILSKGETLFDDINHYGLLFQNDKRWQRVRARRANLLLKLSSPQEFRNYFNDELDQIITSLSRLSMVIEESERCDPCDDFMEDQEFRKVFAELIRRVKTMEESLKNYNQQVVDRDVKKLEICY